MVDNLDYVLGSHEQRLDNLEECKNESVRRMDSLERIQQQQHDILQSHENEQKVCKEWRKKHNEVELFKLKTKQAFILDLKGALIAGFTLLVAQTGIAVLIAKLAGG